MFLNHLFKFTKPKRYIKYLNHVFLILRDFNIQWYFIKTNQINQNLPRTSFEHLKLKNESKLSISPIPINLSSDNRNLETVIREVEDGNIVKPKHVFTKIEDEINDLKSRIEKLEIGEPDIVKSFKANNKNQKYQQINTMLSNGNTSSDIDKVKVSKNKSFKKSEVNNSKKSISKVKKEKKK